MKQTPQKRALRVIKDTGQVSGLNARTVSTLQKKKDVVFDGKTWTLTKKGESKLAGRLGNEANLSRMWTGKTRESALKAAPRKGGKIARTRKTQANDRTKAETQLKKHVEKETSKIDRAFRSVLGPTGTAAAVKVSKTDGGSFDFQWVDYFEDQGFQVIGTRTAPGQPAGTALHGHGGEIYQNPEPPPLGPSGMARALILKGTITRETIAHLRGLSLDVTPAPKALREGITRNPEPGSGKKVYDFLKKMAKKNLAVNEQEIAEATGIQNVAAVLRGLVDQGLAYSPGRDLFGKTWTPGQPQQSLFANPSRNSPKAAEKKALAWYRKESLVTDPVEIDWTPPEAMVDIGDIVAIEYRSDKFDGKSKIFRHDVTKTRKLLVSPDGMTMIILPGFKITTRGIEG